MKKIIWLCIIGILFIAGQVGAQVIADFSSDENGFYDGNWGVFITGIAQMADPTGSNMGGVLAVNIDASQTGGDPKDPISHSGVTFDGGLPALMSYDIWLPADCPNGITVKVYTQDGASWAWRDKKFQTDNIPREVWYPVYFSFDETMAYGGVDYSNGVNGFGIEFSGWNLAGDDTTWSGTIYVDNVSLVGVEPKAIANFETGLEGFSDGNWGVFITDITQVADPTGGNKGNVLSVNIDAKNTGGDPKDPITHSGIEFDPTTTFGFAYEIYLPADCPDGITVKVYTQDGASWAWKDVKYDTKDIPNETWFPVYFSLGAAAAGGGADYTNGVNGFGIEFSGWNLAGDDTTWAGSILVDNVELIGTETGAKWVIAAFENELAGTQGFANNNWGPALTNVSWLADPTNQSDGVMNTDFDFSLGVKGSFDHGNVNIYDADLDTFAHEITIDVYIPPGMPDGAQVSIFAQDHASWTFTEVPYFITDSTLVPGSWYTLSYDVMKFVDAGSVDPKAVLTVGCQIYYSDTNVNWAGSVYWDNFTLIGIPEPAGKIASPAVAARIDTASDADPTFQYVVIEWIDNTVGTETYNVYMSESPITDVNAPGVIRLTNDIPHGSQYWNHRPWSTDGSKKTFYYAVTAKAPDGTETGITNDNVAGPITLPTSVTAKAMYDDAFSTKFTLDGLDNEFTEYAAYKLFPESAGGPESAGWTKESTDMTWGITFVVDDDYLYISADVTDNDLNANGNVPLMEGTQPWMGDALELFMGVYNVNLLDDYHNYRDVDSPGTGDWRIAFTAWGTTGTATSIQTDFPGVEPTVFQKFTGDGYIIEARIALDSLALNNDYTVVDGARMFLSINGNDLDHATNNDSARTLQANWGGGGGPESWLRPGAWGMLEVINGPVGVDQADQLPLEFRLQPNYPNPFNPATTINYELAEKSNIKIVVYDMLGNKVRTIVDNEQPAGRYTVRWDGRNDAGVSVTSGVYFCKMTTPQFVRSQKMMLLK